MTQGCFEARHRSTVLLVQVLLVAAALQCPRNAEAKFGGAGRGSLSLSPSELTLESRGGEHHEGSIRSAARQVRMHRARSRQALRSGSHRHTIASPLQMEVEEAAGPVSFLQVRDDSEADTEAPASRPDESQDAALIRETRARMAAVSLVEAESLSKGGSDARNSDLRSSDLEFDRPPSLLPLQLSSSFSALPPASASAAASASPSASAPASPPTAATEAADSAASTDSTASGSSLSADPALPAPTFEPPPLRGGSFNEASDVVFEPIPVESTLLEAKRPLPSILLVVAAAAAALCGILLFGRSLAVVLVDRWKSPQAVLSPTWELVDALPKIGLAELQRILPEEHQYDCPMVKAVRSNVVVRLEARVLPPANPADVLTAPLSNKECLLYSATVVKQAADASQNLPLAFAMATLDFRVALLDAPEVEIQVQGSDVSLFAMVNGCYLQKRRADRISEHFHDFMTAHRTFPHPSFNVRSGHTLLEFKELSLSAGAIVTIVGELHRDSLGHLSLRPQSDAERPSVQLDDMFLFGRPSISKDVPEKEEQVDRVLLSDHPLLRSGHQKTKIGGSKKQPEHIGRHSELNSFPATSIDELSFDVGDAKTKATAQLLSYHEKEHHVGCSGDTGGSGCCSHT
eukprot:CAMPEP_0206423426 /NCGR_PEP_ID=MMETSP0324_2-20121206/2672_1 /ASSEMBLY_ACC=CAM_ASM_000836 /TAXON_ID=2866 /ORGANISM="Crypthecodinium cohnii, Strain Seligo" /LENGTH=632 /DNA_ID=CAMNT_0053887981 /DNA_START=377 /DNA_END=2275 /DNA_ORIENTATION=+